MVGGSLKNFVTLDNSCPLKYIFLFHECCWEMIFLGSYMFLHVLQVGELTSFVLGYFSTDVCIMNNIGKICVILWSKEQTCSLSSIKDLSSPRSGFPSSNAIQGHPPGSIVLPLWDLKQRKLLQKCWSSGYCCCCQ